MLYLLFVLTFLAGILFYGLSPHDKQLDMTAHQAEGMIITFLAQHQAARDYLYTWLGASNTANTGNLQENNFLQAKVDDSRNPIFPNFETMMPRGVTLADMCADNQGVPGKDSCNDGGSPSKPIPGFVSKVVCTDSAGTGVTGCNDSGAKHYVITYGGWEACTEAEMNDSNHDECYGTNNVKRPSWWPRPGQKLRRFESWRRAIANRTRGSISCGTLVEVPKNSGKWCIDNGETVYKNESAATKECMTQVPVAVMNALPNEYATDGNSGLHDLLFCMSEFKQGLENYVSRPTHFYDGLANVDFGQHDSKTSENIAWKDLAGSDSVSVKFIDDNAYVALFEDAGLLNIGISPSGNFTMTILLKLVNPTTSALFPILSVIGPKDPLFAWDGVEQKYIGTAIQDSGSGEVENTGLISWTFVQGSCEEDSTRKCVSIYENAFRRSYKQMDAAVSGTLTIGVSDANPGADIYGIRYYDSALRPEQIQQNFKVDQKRFGISDVNNGKTDSDIPAIIEEGS